MSGPSRDRIAKDLLGGCSVEEEEQFFVDLLEQPELFEDVVRVESALKESADSVNPSTTMTRSRRAITAFCVLIFIAAVFGLLYALNG